ncbi:hypothetical protein CQW23_11503 [Capsicum baccatum]|uniref:Uncharacterized protein n=1 Tax=Capsicum baccatum TaxID=33114 RepID=A0A2G2WPX2_CAPBA|nr:hypothetical protein CQW23_11503 [Capsicum baccatum]
MWASQREHPTLLQSGSYYNVPWTNTHAAYLLSHAGHGSFGDALASVELSYVQFQRSYLPPQPASTGKPQH